MLRAELTNSFPIDFMEKEGNNEVDSGTFREIIALLKKALTIYIHEGQERMREEEYPFEEYYYFKEEFKCEWE